MHLIVVEDDPRLGRLLGRLFSQDRHVVDLAPGGQDGLELLDANRGFDTVILDVGLPGIDGFEVARRIRSGGSRSPILGIAVAGAGGGLAGIYSAFRAANTPPTEALRS